MAWTAPRTWVTAETPTAATMTTHIKDNLNETMPAKAATVGAMLITDAANSIAERLPASDTVATSEGTTSGTFTDLATSGPAVTATTGADAIAFIRSRISHSAGGGVGFMAIDVSGASTIAAVSTAALAYESSNADDMAQLMAPITFGLGGVLGALTAGSNTFTAKYARTGAGTATFVQRHLTVIPL